MNSCDGRRIPLDIAPCCAINKAQATQRLVRLQFCGLYKNILLPADELAELQRREKAQGITPDLALAAFMQAEIRRGKSESIVSDLIIKMLGLDVG